MEYDPLDDYNEDFFAFPEGLEPMSTPEDYEYDLDNDEIICRVASREIDIKTVAMWGN